MPILTARVRPPNDIFAGPTALHGHCQQVDWPHTALGPVDGWPASLKTAVQLCLDSPADMAVWAGPELVLIYNDGYARTLGPDRHPWALGRTAREVCGEAWDWLAPELERVVRRGESLQFSHRGLYVRGRGAEGDACLTHSHTPIREADGRIVGSLSVVRDTTRERDARRMFDLSPELLAVSDTNDRYRSVNPAFTRVLGWTEEEMRSRPGSFFVHPEDRDGTFRQLRQLADGRAILHFTNRYLCKDGTYRWLSWTAAPVVGEGLIYAAAQDVTDRKLAEQALRRSEAQLARDLADVKQLQRISSLLIGEQPGALYQEIVEATSTLMRSDAASLQLLDSDLNELQLLAWKGFHPDSARHWQRLPPDSLTSCGRAIKRGQRFVVADVFDTEPAMDATTLQHYRLSGIVAVQSTPLRTRDGRLIGVISTHWGRRHEPSEHDLALLDVLARQAADTLERNRSLQTLREADLRKDHFLALLGHELRHPLAALQSGLLVLDRADDPGATLRRVLPLMQREIDQLKRLIDDLVNLSRMTRGKVTLTREHLDLRLVVQDVVEASRVGASRHLRLDLPDEPLMLLGDEARLKQLIGNIVDNAVKYTEEATGSIWISAEREGPQAAVRVRDNGAGVAAEYLERIFDAFEQAGSVDGLGMGLPFARQLALLHGGQVAVRSEGTGRGSEFVIYLPLAGRND